MEYYKTKDPLHVKKILGHKRLQIRKSTCTSFDFESNDFIVQRPKTTKEEDALITAGFEFVRYDEIEKCPIYKKRR